MQTRINSEDNNGTVIFVGAVDEEGNATGIKESSQKRDGCRLCTVLENQGGITQVTIAYKGRLAINLRGNCRRRSSHASAHHGFQKTQFRRRQWSLQDGLKDKARRESRR